MDEGSSVAAALGFGLHDDPWEMNVLATKREARTARRCSRMSRRTGKRRSSRSTEPVRAAARAGVDTPLQSALYALVRAREASYL